MVRRVAHARTQAQRETYDRLAREFTPQRCKELDALLVADPSIGMSRLRWLSTGPVEASATAVKAEVEKLVDETMYDLAGSGENNPYRMAQEVRRRAEKMINQKYKRSPMIVPTIVPMSSESGDVVSDDDVDGTRESL